MTEMSVILPTGPVLAAFLLASLILAVTPGPGVFYIVARSLAQGPRSGLASVAGVALGNFGNAIGAAVGLAAVFTVSSIAFSVVKYAGAVYLLYLGAVTWRAPRFDANRAGIVPGSLKRVFRDGVMVALLNPKTTIFFAAFLPPFLRADASPMAQSVLLGTIFVAVAAVSDSAYAIAASSVAPALTRASKLRAVGRHLLCATFIGLGILTAFTGQRTAK
jgi:threonine/homoserine/homoserine lactone efflux protein